MTEQLSQADQVMIAVAHVYQEHGGEPPARAVAAAALRAAANQVVPDDYDPPRGVSYPEKDAFVDGKCVRNEDIRVALLAIAAELEDR